MFLVNVSQLYAFYYEPIVAPSVERGWAIYRPEQEFERMGLLAPNSDWRISQLNENYEVCIDYLYEPILGSQKKTDIA